MAKLNGVKVIDMINGEITKVSYNGAEYTKVDGKVEAGDIGLRVKQGTSWASIGEYYPIVTNATYADDVGDEPLFHREHFVFFRNLNVKPTPTVEALDAKVDALDKRVAALEKAEVAPEYKTIKRHAKVGERILITNATHSLGYYNNGDVFTVSSPHGNNAVNIKELRSCPFIDDCEYEVIVEPTKAKPKPADKLSHNGADYTLVSRKAQPGDVVVFTENTSGRLDNGKAYGPVAKSKLTDRMLNVEGGFDVYNGCYNRTESNVLVYAPVAEPLKVGDYAKVVEAHTPYNSTYKTGAIVQITKVDESRVPYEAKGVNSVETRWFRESHIVKATDAEVEQALAGAVFTKLGRKPNEYKAGDIVRGYSDREKREVIGVVEDVGEGALGIRTGGDVYRAVEDYVLIAPVESRVDVK